MSGADRNLWLSLADVPGVDLGVTVLFYVLALKIQRRFGGSPVLNPTLVAVLFVVAALELTGVCTTAISAASRSCRSCSAPPSRSWLSRCSGKQR